MIISRRVQRASSDTFDKMLEHLKKLSRQRAFRIAILIVLALTVTSLYVAGPTCVRPT